MWPSASTRRLRTTLRSRLGHLMISQWCFKLINLRLGCGEDLCDFHHLLSRCSWGRLQAPRCEMDRSVKLAWQLTYESENRSLPVVSWQSCNSLAIIKEADECRRYRGSHWTNICVYFSFSLLLLWCREFLLFYSK